MVILNKATIKMLQYIKKHDFPTEGQILKKFGDDGTTWKLISLCKQGYLLCQKPDGKYEEFKDIPYVTSSSYKYWATEQTDKLLEDKSRDLIKWMLPTIISVLALALSILTFIVTALDNSPILVKILP